MPAIRAKQQLNPGQRIRILIVDDSSVFRQLIAQSLRSDSSIEVAGTACNGIEAIDQVMKLKPDLVTLDIEMPEMGGLEALGQIRRLAPQVRIVILSSLTERGASLTLEALSLGADDYLMKVSAARSLAEAKARLSHDLTPRIRQFFLLSPGPPTCRSKPLECPVKANPEIVAIGASTGGPAALGSILGQFPSDFDLPILIVQHMPAVFTQLFCERLRSRLSLPIREATHNQLVRPGVILVAPGGQHMRVEVGAGQCQPRISLDQSPPQNSCRPSVDVLFESLLKVYGPAVVAAVLTGMGHDGLRSTRLLRNAGATILAQDEETSAVWGMPRAIAEANLADSVLPLERIVPHILGRCGQKL